MTPVTALKRIEVLVDEPLAGLIEAAAGRAGVTNWAIIPTVSGMVSGTPWHDDRLTGAGRRMIFLTVLTAPKAEALIDALAPLLESHGLNLFLSDAEVVRAERY